MSKSITNGNCHCQGERSKIRRRKKDLGLMSVQGCCVGLIKDFFFNTLPEFW